MSACSCDYKGPLRELLATHIGEVNVVLIQSASNFADAAGRWFEWQSPRQQSHGIVQSADTINRDFLNDSGLTRFQWGPAIV